MRHLARVAANHTGTAALRAAGQLSRLDPAMALYRAPFGERLPRAAVVKFKKNKQFQTLNALVFNCTSVSSPRAANQEENIKVALLFFEIY